MDPHAHGNAPETAAPPSRFGGDGGAALKPSLRPAAARLAGRDARLYQIAFQATLLGIGVLLRDFSVQPMQMLLTFAAGLATQVFWLRALGIERAGMLSAVITCFGLSLLLRADNPWLHPLCACLAISSKFLIRIRGKHVFNPANLGVVLALAMFPGAWVSPGQWGNDLAYALWVAALGGVVCQRARRWDIGWLFLVCYLGLIAARVAWLGQGWTIWWHQLQSGALLLFAFFMISDPMTIPNRRAARAIYAALVAAAAFVWQFALFKPNGLMWALCLASPLVPVLDWLLPARKFAWQHQPAVGNGGGVG